MHNRLWKAFVSQRKKVILAWSFDSLSEACSNFSFLSARNIASPAVHFHRNKKQLFTWMALNWSGCCIACFLPAFISFAKCLSQVFTASAEGILGPTWRYNHLKDLANPKHALELRDYVKYMFSPCIFTLNLMILIDPMAFFCWPPPLYHIYIGWGVV